MRRIGAMCSSVTVPAAMLALAAAAQAQVLQSIQYIGQDLIPTGTQFQGTTLGGLSGIAYDPAGQRYFSISDDRSQFNPARWYTLNINLAGNQLQPGGVAFTGFTTLLNSGGQPFPAFSLDPEGIALSPTGDLWVASEGDVNANPQVNPFVNRFSPSGQQGQALSVPSKFLPTTGNLGIRNNLAFETLTLAPNGQSLFTATENALKQDGPAAALGVGSPSRILRFDLQSNQPAQEFVYETDPVVAAPNPPGSFVTNGLVEMLALDDTTFLALERSFSTGVGNSIKLYEVSLTGATEVSSFETLPGLYTPVQKTLILDLGTLGITLDNVEGMAFGPTLGNGQQSLILVADNNFSATQVTQFLAFGVTLVPTPGTLALLGLAGMIAARRRR